MLAEVARTQHYCASPKIHKLGAHTSVCIFCRLKSAIPLKYSSSMESLRISRIPGQSTFPLPGVWYPSGSYWKFYTTTDHYRLLSWNLKDRDDCFACILIQTIQPKALVYIDQRSRQHRFLLCYGWSQPIRLPQSERLTLIDLPHDIPGAKVVPHHRNPFRCQGQVYRLNRRIVLKPAASLLEILRNLIPVFPRAHNAFRIVCLDLIAAVRTQQQKRIAKKIEIPAVFRVTIDLRERFPVPNAQPLAIFG